MEIRTYGVEGFMDWQCEIPVGRARAIVHFSGGTMTSYGVTPAEFSTDNPVQQQIIEGSSYFKNGRIKLIRKTGVSEPAKRHEPKTVPATEDEVVNKSEDNATEQTMTGAEEETPESIEVSCLTDAQNYLRDTFGIPTSRSRSKEKAQELARENGIVFVGL